MITGVRTTALGREVIEAFANDREHRLIPKLAARDIKMMATCFRQDSFTDWKAVRVQLPKAEPRHLTACVLKLEKLGLIECDRPVPTPITGKRTVFGFDKEGNHQWL